MMSRVLRILMVEESETNALNVLDELQRFGWTVEFQQAATIEAMAVALKHQSWDVILTGHCMPRLNALDALDVVQRSDADIPVIIVSNGIGEETAVALMKAGANNCVTQDSLSRLPCMIERELRDAENRHARKQVEKERIWLAAVLEYIAESVIVTDAAGCINYVNSAFERITGYNRADVLGKNPRVLKSGKHDRLFYKEFWATILAGEIWSGRIVNVRKDGSFYEEETTVSSIKGEDGRIANFVAVKRDVTAQVQLEQRLRQAQKMEAIGALAGGIAHDFNNVLAAIIGYSQMAAEESEPQSPLREDLERILAASHRAKDLVRQILAFSHRGEVERSSVQLQLVVEEALRLLKPSLPATIEIRQEIDPSCPAVLADPTQMHQIIMNLCTNAYHAMRETGGILEIGLKSFDVNHDIVKTHPGLHAGLHACLIISDTGHGMSRQTMEHIFEPFFTTKAPGEGTGLGLATAHAIARSHGGVVTVYSELGQGSTFKVFIPAIEVAESSETHTEPVPLRGGTERILVVDDEAQLVDLIGRTLTRFGYEVTTMTSSTDAMAAFRAHPAFFDLVITDQTMPQMTGEQLVRSMMEIRPDLPVILTTGFSEMMSKERAEELGVCAYMMKPTSSQEMVETVQRVLDQFRAEYTSHLANTKP